VTRTEPSAEATDDAQMAAILGELTQAVRKFSVERRSVPKNLEELVANGYLARAPQAPAGNKFVISKELQVQLVKK
jgi:competence protein ComGC